MPPAQQVDPFPEENMILVAVMLAILEKFTTVLGTLNFIWATTVLLGGFASSLNLRDFWFVSIILVAEGIRIFGRKGELHTGSYFFDTIIKLYSMIIQDISAGICLMLSTKFIFLPLPQTKAQNQNLALKIFYVVSILESILILIGLLLRLFSGTSPRPRPTEKPRLHCRFRWISRWVLDVKEKCGLDDSQIHTLYRFFHNTYSQCVRGSILDSSNITIVSYSVELLQSSNGDEQLRGARLLFALVKENMFSLERLGSIEAIRGVVKMLIDMLNWEWNKNPERNELRIRIGIRRAAAEIIFKLVEIRRNRTLVMAAPGSMESIAYLLDDGNRAESPGFMQSIASLLEDGNRAVSPGSMESRASLLDDDNIAESLRKYPYLGLKILQELANDDDNRAKMGSNRGLLLKIITLTESKSCERLQLKVLAIETLTSIARDQELRESIGCTDGVLHNLFSLFFQNIDDNNDDERQVRISAGKALGFLSLDNNQNGEIMKTIRRAYFRNLIPSLISVLNDGERGTYAARILRNLSADLEVELNASMVLMQREFRANSVELNASRVLMQREFRANSVELNAIIEASEEVVGIVLHREGMHQEAAIGLAAQIFKFLSESDYQLVFGRPEDEKQRSLFLKLRDVLRQHASPSEELPNIRRFTILLLIAVIERMGRSTIPQGSQDETDLNNALKGAMNTTSALESCSTLSGGLRSDSMAIPFVAQYAMQLLHN